MSAARDHVVAPGECISQLAFEAGHFWQTVWGHPKNESLRKLRGSPFVLAPGDVVHIPALREKGVTVPTGATHRFRVHGVPARIRLRVESEGEPMAEEPYELVVDGKTTNGTTGPDGLVEAFVAPDAADVTLHVGTGEQRRTYPLGLRRLDPMTTVSGLQGRLRNLGLYPGAPSGNMDDTTREAIMEFQRRHALAPSGVADERLYDKLRQEHGY